MTEGGSSRRGPFAGGGMATRLALLVSAGVLVLLILGTAGFLADRARDSLALFGFNLSNRVTAIVRLVESLPPERAGQVLQAANSPSLRVLPLPAEVPIAEALPEDGVRPRFIDRDGIAARVRDRLPGLRDRGIVIRFLDAEAAARLARIGGRLAAPDLLESQRKIAILVPLQPPVGSLDGPAMPGAVAPGHPPLTPQNGIPSGSQGGTQGGNRGGIGPPPTGDPQAGTEALPEQIPMARDGPLALPADQGNAGDAPLDRATGGARDRDHGGPPAGAGIARAQGTPHALIFIASYESPSIAWLARTAGLLLLVGIALVAFTLWAARRATRPFRAFAAAADRLGVDVDAPRLPETGSAELRHAARAFNTMADRLGRLLADRAQMVAAISHDLRTMLTRLRLRAELIDDPVQRDKAFDDLDQMAAMVNATLSFARDDAKREARAPLDLARLLQSLIDDHADAGADARYEGPERCVIQAQPIGLRRVFDNLIGNALAYAGDVTVRLTPPNARGTGQAVTVEVIDHGPGIPPDRREDVFAPFVRLEASRNRETGGTGLGLAVARGIVRAHGGDITLAETPGGGLAVTLIFPP